MEYDHRSINLPLLNEERHRTTAPLLDEDDAPGNMQQTLSAEAIPVYDTHPHAYAVAIPENNQQRALASSSSESGQESGPIQKIIANLFGIIFIVGVVGGIIFWITKYVAFQKDFNEDDDN
jgi:tetrahydromethanopterin S-methyltransferase subunit C